MIFFNLIYIQNSAVLNLCVKYYFLLMALTYVIHKLKTKKTSLFFSKYKDNQFLIYFLCDEWQNSTPHIVYHSGK